MYPKEEEINSVEVERKFLEGSLEHMMADIGPIPIADEDIMPFGWRKAAKGRTVWRIVEEIISQNLELKADNYGFEHVEPAPSEVGVWDFRFKHPNGNNAFVNIKSSVLGGRKNKDDISKAAGIESFYDLYPEANLYVATFILKFNDNMTIEIVDVVVFPVSWIPDLYVNPSNNGNLQSSKYKDIDNAKLRTNQEFIYEFDEAYEVAKEKRRRKNQKK